MILSDQVNNREGGKLSSGSAKFENQNSGDYSVFVKLRMEKFKC